MTGKKSDASISTELAHNRTRWAADRTFWAADRTLIAWIRTSLALIGFGFGIGKVVDYVEKLGREGDPFRAAQYVGGSLVALAVLALVGAIIQNVRIDRRLAKHGYGRVEPWPLGLVAAVLLLLIGVFAFVALLL